jgi:hypothetical protein
MSGQTRLTQSNVITLTDALGYVNASGYLPWDTATARERTEQMQSENLVRFKRQRYWLTRRGSLLYYAHRYNLTDLRN